MLQCSPEEQQLVNFMQVADLKCSFQGDRIDIAGRVFEYFHWIAFLFYQWKQGPEHLDLENPGMILQTEHLLLPHLSPRLG